MREKVAECTVRLWDGTKRFGFSSLWLVSVQVLSCIICYGVLYLFWSNHAEWLVYTAGLLLPILWGFGGYWLPRGLRVRGRWQTGAFLLLWTVLPGLLCCWADLGGPDILWVTLYPQLMARLAWFHPLFDGPQPANVIENLQPLAAAGTHVLMMAGCFMGLWISGRKKKKSKSPA